jgi:hypothetical protein
LEKEGEINADKGRYIDSTKHNDTEQKGEGINKLGSGCGGSVGFAVVSRF